MGIPFQFVVINFDVVFPYLVVVVLVNLGS